MFSKDKACARLKELRISQGLSQEQLADDIGVTKQAYSRWETGSASNVPIDYAFQLADYFHVTLDYLYGKSDDPNPAAAEATEYTGLTQRAVSKLHSIKNDYGQGQISLISDAILSRKFISILVDLYLLKSRSNEIASLSPQKPILKDEQEAIHLKRGFSIYRSANDFHGFAEIVTGIDALHYRADKAIRKMRLLVSDICGIAAAENEWAKKCKAEHDAYNNALDDMEEGSDDGK